MHNPNTIKTLKKDVTLYPNTPAVLVDVIGADNKVYEATITKAEAEMLLYLKGLRNKLSEKEMNKLIDLIEDYGQEQYSIGYDNCDSQD